MCQEALGGELARYASCVTCESHISICEIVTFDVCVCVEYNLQNMIFYFVKMRLEIIVAKVHKT